MTRLRHQLRCRAPGRPRYFPAGFIHPCIVIQLAKASNQPVLVVVFGYMPNPWPPC